MSIDLLKFVFCFELLNFSCKLDFISSSLHWKEIDARLLYVLRFVLKYPTDELICQPEAFSDYTDIGASLSQLARERETFQKSFLPPNAQRSHPHFIKQIAFAACLEVHQIEAILNRGKGIHSRLLGPRLRISSCQHPFSLWGRDPDQTLPTGCSSVIFCGFLCSICFEQFVGHSLFGVPNSGWMNWSLFPFLQ